MEGQPKVMILRRKGEAENLSKSFLFGAPNWTALTFAAPLIARTCPGVRRIDGSRTQDLQRDLHLKSWSV